MLKKFQRNFFLGKNKEKLVETLENAQKRLQSIEDEKEKIEYLIIIENIKESLKTVAYVADNNLSIEQFKEFDEGVIESFSKETSENIANVNNAFFEVMYAKIDKLQTVEEIYNEIVKLKEMDSICKHFEKISGRFGGTEQFYQKIQTKIKELRNQGKISVLPDLEKER
jgi:hypothetical protein